MPSSESERPSRQSAQLRARTAAVAEGKITFETFREYTDVCRVRRLQRRYEEVAATAKLKDTSIDDVIADLGYRDFHHFNKECEQFPVNVDPTELAELGSGFVLYFQFLKFLGLLLVVLFACGLPAMAIYGGEGALATWEFHDWRRSGWTRTRSTCACLGDNRGFQGPDERFHNDSYGTSCQLWDLESCQAPRPEWTPARWCCVSWCFSDPSCPVGAANQVKGPPSLANRRYAGLVRATSQCPQPNISALPLDCARWSEGIFDAAGRYDDEHLDFTSSKWLTPGNLGPEGAESRTPLVCYVVCVVIFCVLIIGMSEHQQVTASWVEDRATMPRDFAIMVKHLPCSVDEEGIRAWFSKHAVADQETEIVKVIVGYNLSAVKRLQDEVDQRRAELQRLEAAQAECASDAGPGATGRITAIIGRSSMWGGGSGGGTEMRDPQAIIAELQGFQNMLHLQTPGAIESSGAAVIVFRYQRDLKACLWRWHSWWGRRFSYHEPGHCFGLLRGGELPRFPPSPGVEIKVKQSANPGDINWQRMGSGRRRKWRRCMSTTTLMVVVVSVCFVSIWALKQQEVVWKEQAASENAASVRRGYQALSLVPAALIMAINFVLRSIARALAEREELDTLSEMQFSEAIKATIAMIVNTSGVILFVNAQPKEWYIVGGLVDDVMFMLLLDALVGRFAFLVDTEYLMDRFYARSLTQETLDEWNAKVAQNYPPKSIVQQEELNEVVQEVEKFKSYYEPAEMDTAERYARALNTFLISVFFAPLAPWAPLIGLVGLLLQYWLDKWLLLRWYRRSNPRSSVQAAWALQVVRFSAPMSIAVSVFVFLTPSWAEPHNVRMFAAWCFASAFLVSALPMPLLKALLLEKCCVQCALAWLYGKSRADSQLAEESNEDYYNAQYMWPKGQRYHKDHPVYKAIPATLNPEILQPGGVAASPPARSTAVLTVPRERAGSRRSEAAPLRSPSPEQPRCEEALPPEWQTAAAHPAARSRTGSMGSAGQKPSYAWQFETASCFKVFAPEAQEIVEAGFQEFLAGGPHRMVLSTGGHSISLDFVRMSQKVLPGGKVRKIRRVDTE